MTPSPSIAAILVSRQGARRVKSHFAPRRGDRAGRGGPPPALSGFGICASAAGSRRGSGLDSSGEPNAGTIGGRKLGRRGTGECRRAWKRCVGIWRERLRPRSWRWRTRANSIAGMRVGVPAEEPIFESGSWRRASVACRGWTVIASYMTPSRSPWPAPCTPCPSRHDRPKKRTRRRGGRRRNAAAHAPCEVFRLFESVGSALATRRLAVATGCVMATQMLPWSRSWRGRGAG